MSNFRGRLSFHSLKRRQATPAPSEKSLTPRDLSTIRKTVFLSRFLLKSTIIQNSKTEDDSTLHFTVYMLISGEC